MSIINKDNWAYKLWMDDSVIIYILMEDRNLSPINGHDYGVPHPPQLRYIYVTSKGNIYILIRNKKNDKLIEEEQEPEPFSHHKYNPEKYMIVKKGIKYWVKKIDEYHDYEIYDAIIDNQIVPIKYFPIIKEHISKFSLVGINEMVEYLKYVKREISEKNNFLFKEELRENLIQYKEQTDKKIIKLVGGLKAQVERYEKIEQVIKKNFPHLTKYFDLDIDLIIKEEDNELIQTRNILREKLDKLKTHMNIE